MSLYRHTITSEIREFDSSVLAAHPKAALWVAYTPPAPESASARWRVSKDTIITRLSVNPSDLANVMAALATQSEEQQFIFTQSAWFWSDNATLRGLCAALGIDADALLDRDPFLF